MKGNIKKSYDKGFCKFYIVLKHHYIITTIVCFIPAIWLPIIVRYLGKNLNLISENSLTFIGWISTILIYTLSLLVTIFINYSAKATQIIHDNEIKQARATVTLSNTIMDCTYKICANKYNDLCNNALEYYDTKKQIEFILSELQNSISSLMNIRSRDLCVSLAYKINDKDIEWICTSNTGSGNTRKILASNTSSSFYQVYTNLCDFLFYNDKNVAMQEGRYIYNSRDKSNQNNGSIMCKRISVMLNNQKKINAVLSVNSYVKFDKTDNPEVIKNIKNNIQWTIIAEFEKRIQIELINIYNRTRHKKNELTICTHQ